MKLRSGYTAEEPGVSSPGRHGDVWAAVLLPGPSPYSATRAAQQDQPTSP